MRPEIVEHTASAAAIGIVQHSRAQRAVATDVLEVESIEKQESAERHQRDDARSAPRLRTRTLRKNRMSTSGSACRPSTRTSPAAATTAAANIAMISGEPQPCRGPSIIAAVTGPRT